MLRGTTLSAIADVGDALSIAAAILSAPVLLVSVTAVAIVVRSMVSRSEATRQHCSDLLEQLTDLARMLRWRR